MITTDTVSWRIKHLKYDVAARKDQSKLFGRVRQNLLEP